MLFPFYRTETWSVATALLIAALVHAGVVTDWNTVALHAIRAGNTSPPIASRSLAILHVAEIRQK